MGKPVHSMSELAKHLGLSRWTVSRVLNGHKGIHPDTAARVRDAIRELKFSPNPLAQGLRGGRTNLIGVCLPEIEEYHLGYKLESLRRALAPEGFHMMVAITNGDKREEADTLGRFRVLRAAGVVLIASRLAAGNVTIRQLREEGIPLVNVDPMAAPPRESFSVDRAAGMKEAVHHLLDLGHRSIAIAGISGQSRYSQARLEGVSAAFAERGLDAAQMAQTIRQLPLPEGNSRDADNFGLSLYETGRRTAAAFCKNGPVNTARPSRSHPTAVLALNDRLAIGLIDGLRDLGLRVPQEVSVVGYDNMEAGAFFSPRLTTIDIRPDELIAHTTARLLHQIRNPGAPLPAQPHIASRLVVRASTGCPPLSPFP